MTTEEKAASICEFAVAKLDVKPGDVVVVKIPADQSWEVQRHFSESLDYWATVRGLGFHFLVVSADADIPTVVHTLTPEEIDKAGAGGWPHEPHEIREHLDHSETVCWCGAGPKADEPRPT
jgi:hypothetical protein